MPTCPACKGNFKTTSNGSLRTHGPLNSRCKGSQQKPLVVNEAVNVQTNKTSSIGESKGNDQDQLFGHIATVRWIPRTLIALASSSFAEILEKVCDSPNNENCWRNLLRWAQSRLASPTTKNKQSRSDRCRALREQLTSKTPQIPESRTDVRETHNYEGRLATAVRRRVDTGDIQGAVRILANDGKMVEPNEQATTELRAKHPEGSKELKFTHQTGPPIQFTDKQLKEALEGLPVAGAPGPDGLRPSHLKQLCGGSAGVAQEKTISALRNFSNVCLSGNIPSAVRPLFFGASLCALRKKDGVSLRPIAIGIVIRRFVSRLCCLVLRNQMTALLAPHQLGVGVPGGSETAVHATRRYLQNCDADWNR